ncbi:hypothetical protein P154DRAFT_578599 [Amniculicola lignicola CBS 123094]|uniref:SRR1-like domain-containing protein n=1 Tax=Amniculicola lignicola CBS 123094 TaxID=1392246 RepID=A0A6A5WC14_9PLEO|nr:hypothetical protein P154DRAFT_578599 [Amniculicola lignicola CBS 123094]
MANQPPLTYFTKAHIEEASNALQNLGKTERKFTLKDDLGNAIQGQVSICESERDRPTLCYHSYQTRQLIACCVLSRGDAEHHTGHTCPVWIGNQPIWDRCKHTSSTDEQWALWKKEWEKSPMCRNIKDLANGKVKIPNVTKIICFGLGCPDLDDSGLRYGGSHQQHLAACTLRDVLSEILGADIKIYAQDPNYCAAGKQMLMNKFGITIVDDPAGWLLLDAETLVMTVCPSVCVRQIACDILKDSGGPAGLFGFKIVGDGVFPPQKTLKLAWTGPQRSKAFVKWGTSENWREKMGGP